MSRPGVASHDQKPDRGIVSGIKSPPLARTPLHGIYIDRCINPVFHKLPFLHEGNRFDQLPNSLLSLLTVQQSGDSADFHFLIDSQIINNYSLKSRGIVVKYLPSHEVARLIFLKPLFTEIEKNNCFSIYTRSDLSKIRGNH